ncbi:MAG: hypothetical protein HQK49_10305 [Oligoflexia bacterium]|nr:hypothetical protein [Oligoflexia bacterium]
MKISLKKDINTSRSRLLFLRFCILLTLTGISTSIANISLAYDDFDADANEIRREVIKPNNSHIIGTLVSENSYNKKNNTKKNNIKNDRSLASSENNEIEQIISDDDVAVVKKSNNNNNNNGEKAATKDKNVIKYKNFEKFNFDELDVSGDGASEGGISIAPREERKYQNKLPEKNNFNNEFKKTIDSIN